MLRTHTGNGSAVGANSLSLCLTESQVSYTCILAMSSCTHVLHLYPLHVTLYTRVLHLYPSHVILYTCVLYLYPSHVILYTRVLQPSSVMLYTHVLHLYPSHVILYTHVLHLYPSHVILYTCFSRVLHPGAQERLTSRCLSHGCTLREFSGW